MDKKELEQLKEELRKELKQEIQSAIESSRNLSIWSEYAKEYINPFLTERGLEPRYKYQIKTSINTFARVLANKKQVSKITQNDLENIKPSIEKILSVLEA